MNAAAESPDSFLTGTAYSIAEAARLSGTSRQTIQRWLLGYTVAGHRVEPMFGARPATLVPYLISFLDLVEIMVVDALRKGAQNRNPVRLDRLRKAHEFARKKWGPHPFARHELKEFGGHVLHEFEAHEPDKGTLVLSLNGQYLLPGTVTARLDELDFEGEFPTRWYPKGREVPIVIDPHLAAGQPTIAGTGVTVDRVLRRFTAGDPIKLLAEDFDLDPSAIEEAVRFAQAA